MQPNAYLDRWCSKSEDKVYVYFGIDVSKYKCSLENISLNNLNRYPYFL